MRDPGAWSPYGWTSISGRKIQKSDAEFERSTSGTAQPPSRLRCVIAALSDVLVWTDGCSIGVRNRARLMRGFLFLLIASGVGGLKWGHFRSPPPRCLEGYTIIHLALAKCKTGPYNLGDVNIRRAAHSHLCPEKVTGGPD